MASLAAGLASGCLKAMQRPCTPDLCMLTTCERQRQKTRQRKREENGRRHRNRERRGRRYTERETEKEMETHREEKDTHTEE